MTMWQPQLDPQRPHYHAIADAIARDLQSGMLRAGDRLPTHRDLADALGVTVGTVSRGYAEAERRGLTRGVVGRGTFLRGISALDPWSEASSADASVIDLSLSLPVSLPEDGAALAETLREIALDPRIGGLLQYQADSSMPHQRTIAADWLNQTGLSLSADDVLVTSGSQHGLNVVLSSLFHAGQVLLTEELTYPSIKPQARSYGVRLRGVHLDEEGMCPESLERACQIEPKPSGVYIIPTVQNPTSATMSPERRQAIVRIAEKYDLWIIEDDVHAFLLPDPPTPVAALAPKRTVYLSSVAKCLAPGLRTGFLSAAPDVLPRLLTGIHNSVWMPPPLMVEVTTRWLNDGTAERLMAAKRRETEARQSLVQKILGQYKPRAHPLGYQAWLDLPEPWCADNFIAEVRERGIKLIGGSAFAINRGQVPYAVRLSIGVPTRPDLERGLKTIDQILAASQTTASY